MPVASSVREGIMDLLAAFPIAGARADDERVRSMRLFGKAMDGFDGETQLRALQRLVLHNPRNPFPPTPQDVYEQCCKLRVAWWRDPERVALLTDDHWRLVIAKNADVTWPVAELGPPPGTERCVVPQRMIEELRLTDRYDMRGIEKSTWSR